MSDSSARTVSQSLVVNSRDWHDFPLIGERQARWPRNTEYNGLLLWNNGMSTQTKFEPLKLQCCLQLRPLAYSPKDCFHSPRLYVDVLSDPRAGGLALYENDVSEAI